MIPSAKYVYLTWSLLLLLFWAFVFLGVPQHRRKMLWMSLITAPLGLTEPLFVPSYWTPPTLFDLAIRTGFDIEALVFSFAVGGLASILYETLFRVKVQALTPQECRSRRHRFHRLAVATPLWSFPLFYALPINVIYNAILAMVAGGVAVLLCRPDLWRGMLSGAVIFALVYFVYFSSLVMMHPGYVREVWHLTHLSGILVAGIPLEELLFALALGFFWSGLYEHLHWDRWQLSEPPTANRDKPASL